MADGNRRHRIAILGGGPSALFVCKRLVESGLERLEIEIFEATNRLGAGMPYSGSGAEAEHVTNVSSNEIPKLATSLSDWLQSLSPDILAQFNFRADRVIDYRVVPRLLFGDYLEAQFGALRAEAERVGLPTRVHFKCAVSDVIDGGETGAMTILAGGEKFPGFDHVVVCTGHFWPRKQEGSVPEYFDSPYPPAKLRGFRNHPIAIRGASLTAIDAVRTLARSHGHFSEDEAGRISFHANPQAPRFKLILHSRNGLLPGVRFHLEDPHLSKKSLLTREELARHRRQNGGFVSLDYLFEKDFKDAFRESDPAFHRFVEPLSLEEFVEAMMKHRESMEPFALLRKEYAEAKESIRRKESIFWKEMLATLSFAVNYPAKHFSAEDMLRLQKVLMPLVSVVIAFAPQRSLEELMALREAGRLELLQVGSESEVVPHPEGGVVYHYVAENGERSETRFLTFVDCVGQPHLPAENFPFPSLAQSGSVAPARLKFRSEDAARQAQADAKELVEKNPDGTYVLKVPGVAINDSFQAIKSTGTANPRLYLMAPPHMGGHNPDYSGLDFCEAASHLIVTSICNQIGNRVQTRA